jgi:myosin protein heavy chain
VERIEGENDFSGKRYVWLRDSAQAFVRGWVVEELEGDKLLVQCDDGSVRKTNRMSDGKTDKTHSNATSTKKKSTKSTPPNSTKQTTWPSSHT